MTNRIKEIDVDLAIKTIRHFKLGVDNIPELELTYYEGVLHDNALAIIAELERARLKLAKLRKVIDEPEYK